LTWINAPIASGCCDYEPRLCDEGVVSPTGATVGGPLSLTLPLSEEIPSPYNRPFPFHRLVLGRTQGSFPFAAGVVLVNSDSIGNLKVVVGCAIEADCVVGAGKLSRWGLQIGCASPLCTLMSIHSRKKRAAPFSGPKAGTTPPERRAVGSKAVNRRANCDERHRQKPANEYSEVSADLMNKWITRTPSGF
jgi:carbonic anhydrase/acetyltransferase-like protein (isoleucine patch superfamily)